MGPGNDYPGGILSVIHEYMKSPILRNLNLKHIVTVKKNRKYSKFIQSIVYYYFLCLFRKVSLCHIHMSERGSCDRAIVIIDISKMFNVPVIVHSHGSEIIGYYNSLNKASKEKFDLAMSYASRILILTPGWSEFWGKIVDADKLTIVPNGVEMQHIKKKKHKYNNKLNILFLGYVGDRKGTFDLVYAMKKIVDSYKKTNVLLEIAGNGEIEKCRNLVNKLGLTNYINVLGWVDKEQKYKLLSKADILVLPSYFESFGIVALEAMAFKVPVVCGDKGFTKELINNGENGLIAETGNPIDIANKILEAEMNLSEMGENGYKKVHQYYSFEKVENQIKKIYIQEMNKC